MRFTACIFLLLLLGTHPANSARYLNLENALGADFIRLLLDTDLTVQTPPSPIQTLDFTEIFVWGSDTIFVGTSNYILKINSTFGIERTYSVNYTGVSCSSTTNTYLPSCGNYFRVFLNITDSLYTCYTNRVSNPVCLALDPETLAEVSSPPVFNQMSGVDMGFISPSLPARLYQRNFAIYLNDNNGDPRLVTGSVYDGRERNRITVTDPFNSSMPYITTTFYYFEQDADIRKFFDAASFARTAHSYVGPDGNTYIYFMFYEPSDKLLSGTAISRIGRFCLEGPSDPNPTGNSDIELPQMETFVKGELQCGDVFPSLVQDWLFADIGGVVYYYAVFSSLEKGPKTSYLCKYNLSSIDSTMSEVKQCAPNPILESDAITPTADSPLIGHSGALFTQLQRHAFDYNGTTYEMIYVTLTNGSIIKYCINCEIQLVEMIQVVPSLVIASFPDLTSLDRLELNGDHLLAGGYTGLFKVPLQTCSLQDCISCMGDPMCYLNTTAQSCMAITPTTPLPTPSNSILYLDPTLQLASCSNISANITVDILAVSTRITVMWNCPMPMADSVDIYITFSDESSDVMILSDGSESGMLTMDLSYLNLSLSYIDTVFVKPFLTHNTIQRPCPGTILRTNVMYDVIQGDPPVSTSCTPFPPRCDAPVCVDKSSCSEFCSPVTIDCSQAANDNCTVGIRYSINGTTLLEAPANRIIQVDFDNCSQGCLFQAYAYSDSLETAGTSHWLNLLPPLSQFSPVISAERTSASQFSFSAYFSQFSTHTCESPSVTTNPLSSPLNLTTCSQDITAVWTSNTIGTSDTASVEVFSSQEVRATNDIQLNLSLGSTIDECTYSSNVTVSWELPTYAITNGAQATYIIDGDVCSGTVTGVTTHTCSDVTLSYNTQYTVSVTSLEPCFNRSGAVANMSTVSVMSDPAEPRGLGYTFSADFLTLSWSPPPCTPLDGAISYRVLVRRSLCGDSSQNVTMDTTNTSDTMLQIPLTGSSIYEYNIALRAMTDGVSSRVVPLGNVFTPVGSDFNCVDCRVRRVIINSVTRAITCESTPACENLIIASTNVTLTFTAPQSSTSTVLDQEQFQTGCAGLQYDFSPYLDLTGLYTISVRHSLEHSCSDAECTTELANAFYYYNVVSINTPTVSNPQTGEICQDEKAYIILALAVIAIVCAVGNFGFMVVAFCVFCIPRRKIFRCC